MLQLKNITISDIDENRKLIDNFSYVLDKGDKTAIIGEEGNGKSTLLKFIFDRSLIESYCRFSGTVICDGKIGYMSQTLEEGWNAATVEDYFFEKTPLGEKDFALYDKTSEMQETLSKVGLDSSLLFSPRKISTLSGGEKIKLRIAKTVFSSPDILLLDEPTNDLDLPSILWMEDFIKNSRKAIMFVSHDEYLLRKTANRIIHMEQTDHKNACRLTCASLSYDEYTERRQGLLSKQDQEARKDRELFELKEERWRRVYDKVDFDQDKEKNDHNGRLLKKKMHSLLSQERRLDKEEEKLTPMVDVEEAIDFQFRNIASIKDGTTLADLNLGCLKAGDKVLSGPIKLKITSQDKIVIIGANGTGKTTLLKQIKEAIEASGKVKVGYMPQNYEDEMDFSKLPLDFICPSSVKEERLRGSAFLGSFRFTPEEMKRPLRYLSAGQRGKLFLARFAFSGAAFLLLDEPTRNFSPLSNPAIRQALLTYQGGFVAVSHDRAFIEEVGQKVFVLDKTGLEEYTGNNMDF